MKVSRLADRTGYADLVRFLAVIASLLVAPPALAQVVPKVGPKSPIHPFPIWYEDGNGLRLEPCLAPVSAQCGIVAGIPGLDAFGPFDPAAPIAFPNNFPSEVFYQSVVAQLDAFGVAKGFQVVMRVEGTFFQNLVTGQFDSTQPMVFSRIRFTQLPAANGINGQTYTVTYPFGTQTFTADAAGDFFAGKRSATIDVPLGLVFNPNAVPYPAPDIFNNPANTFVNFLTQAPLAGAPAGYVGDGVTPVAITGNPAAGQPLVKLQGSGVVNGTPGATGNCGVDCIQITLMPVVGKLFLPAGVVADRLMVTGTSDGTAGVQQTITVKAIDANGNVASGYTGTVHFTSNDPKAVLPTDAPVTGGIQTFKIEPRTAGALVVHATDLATSTITGASAPAAIAPAAAASMVQTAGQGQTGAEGEALAQPFTVQIADPFGNVVPGANVTFTAPAGASINPASATTAADGTASATATLGKSAGKQTFTVSSSGLPDISLDAEALAPGASSSNATASGKSSSGGGCGSTGAGTPLALLAALALLFRRRANA